MPRTRLNHSRLAAVAVIVVAAVAAAVLCRKIVVAVVLPLLGTMFLGFLLTVVVFVIAEVELRVVYRRIPEYSRITDPRLRRRVSELLGGATVVPASARAALLGGALLWLFAGAPFVLVCLVTAVRGAWQDLRVPCTFGFATAAALGAMILAAKGVRRAVRQALNDAGAPTCMHCGYDCRSISESRCPECGQEYVQDAR